MTQADPRARPRRSASNEAIVVQTDWGRFRITQALYHHKVPRALYVRSDQPNCELKKPLPRLMPSGALKADYLETHTHAHADVRTHRGGEE